jgi:hypothetical protein
LVEEECDPTTNLTVDGVALADISMAFEYGGENDAPDRSRDSARSPADVSAARGRPTGGDAVEVDQIARLDRIQGFYGR